MTAGLAAFLAARLDEDEERAKKWAEPGGTHWPWLETWMLREVAAKRAILAAYENAQRRYDSKVTMRDLAEDRYQAGVVSGLRQAVQELADVYSDLN